MCECMNVSLPGSTRAVSVPQPREQGPVLEGHISRLVAPARERELQQAWAVQTEAGVHLQASVVQIQRPHLGRELSLALRQELIGRDVDRQLVLTHLLAHQHSPDEVLGVGQLVPKPVGSG